MEIHQKKAGLDDHRLKTMVKRSIEQDSRIKNFEARNGNYENNAVVKNQGTKQRVQRYLGDCRQWKANGLCSKSKGFAPIHSWKNGPEYLFHPRMDAEILGKVLSCVSPGWRTAKQTFSQNGEQSAVVMLKSFTTIGLRVSGYWTVEVFIDFSDEFRNENESDVFNLPKESHVMQTFKTKIHRLEWFAQVILSSVTPILQNFECRSQEETERQERCAREAAWRLAKSILKLKEKNIQKAFFSPSENKCLRHQPSNLRKENVDSAASMQMISKKDLNSVEVAHDSHIADAWRGHFCFTELDIFLTMKVFEDALAVLSRKALRWARILIRVDQRSKTASNWKNSVRSWFPGLSTSSSTNFSLFILRLRLPHQLCVKWQWNGKIGETRWPSQPKIQNQIKNKDHDLERSSHEVSLELARSVDLGKHSVHIHFPIDRNWEICCRPKISRAPCRRRVARVVPCAEFFGDLIAAIIDTQSWCRTWPPSVSV